MLGLVVATALAVTSAAPTTDAGEADVAGRGAGDAVPVPVQRGDLDYSPALARLAMSCAAGEFASCDVLYGASDPFSDHSSYGSTCGGRTEVEYDGTCDELFD